MAINFNNVPQAARASNIYIEMAGERRSLAGLYIPPTVGLVGQYDPLKTATVDYEPVKVTSKDEVGSLFGFGSHIHRQALRMPNSVFLQGGGVYAFPIPEAAGTAATADVTFVGDATSSGTLFFLIGGELVQVAVTSGDAIADIAAALAAAITANQNLAVTATSALGVTTIDAKFKGTAGNEIYIKLNPGGTTQENQNPSGTVVSGIDAYMASGATDPSVEDVFFTSGADKLGDRWYTIFTCPFTDATNLGFYKSAGDGRADPATHLPFGAVAGYVKDTYTQALAIPATINSEWISPIWDDRTWAPAWELSASVVGQVANEMNLSPARPYKTLATGIEVNASVANKLKTENDALFRAGMSYCFIDTAGVHRLGDLALSYRTNDVGGDATDWYELVELTLRQAKLYSIEQLFLTTKYNRGVVVDDTSTATADYAIAPKDVIADMTKLISELWVPEVWTKNQKTVIKSLAAEINSGNNGRIDSSVTDDEAKALRIIAQKYAFLY
jgi:phage tail sheath gpL-like